MSSRILVALRVPGPPDRAFEVFTAEVGLWWRDSPLFRFTPRSPGTLAFEPPQGEEPGRFVEHLPSGKTFTIGEVSVWEPGRRLVFGWCQAAFTPDQHTQVEIAFEPVGDETRVTVTHTGWDSVPSAHVAKHGMAAVLFGQYHAAWWRTLLSSLRERLG